MELIQTALYPFFFTLTRLFDLVKNFSTSIQTPVSVSVCLTCGLCTVSEYEPSVPICKTVFLTVGQHQRKLPSSSFLFLETKPPRKSSALAVYQTRRTILQNLLLLLFFHSRTLPKQYFGFLLATCPFPIFRSCLLLPPASIPSRGIFRKPILLFPAMGNLQSIRMLKSICSMLSTRKLHRW